MKLLDGDYSFVIISKEETILCKDRHGTGPQFYYSNTFFASNLNQLLNFKSFSAKPNYKSLFTFLSLGYIPSPECSLEGVKKLPADTVLINKYGNTVLTKINTFEDFMNSAGTLNISEADVTNEYKNLHKKAIQARVANKNSIGLLLSGGYDSGGNIAALRDFYDGKVNCFSIGFKRSTLTELPFAKILAKTYNAEFYPYEIDGSEINYLPEIVDYLGDPFQEGGLMVNYSVMKIVSQSRPEILLGGDGNDQYHGTSGKELALNWRINKNGFTCFQKLFSSISDMSIFEKDNIFFRARFHNEKILNIQKSDTFGFSESLLKRLVLQKQYIQTPDYTKLIPKKFKNFDEFYYVHNYLLDIQQVINNVILFKASKMASMFGNNLTFPYMSTDLYNFLKQLPVNLKFHGTVEQLSKGAGTSKFTHKQYFKPKLPPEIINRKRQGGFAPLPIFLKDNDRRKMIENIILKSDATNELFNKKFLNNCFSKYDAVANTDGYWFWYKQVKATQMFNLLVVSLWWERFINNKSKNKLSEF
ncbi:MAG: asparagine synthetase B family protein [Bacteroidetes bacterium]|nr:asparagine synthetase B family protein [Bacteroidota bacterium]MBT6686486.1 asparagine synthetase B family protein [Bacteroidota bacterium]MBT7143340.1 asparagine synthetase B family protein [Bacteroidota bacterium]